MNIATFRARHAMGRIVRGPALVAHDGFSARYDLDRVAGIFSRPTHKLAGQSYVGKILVLDTAEPFDKNEPTTSRGLDFVELPVARGFEPPTFGL